MKEWKASQKCIAPYRWGPCIYPTDQLVCSIGQCERCGPFRLCAMATTNYVYIPFIKYYFCCNPLVYPLGEKLMQQITTSMIDMHPRDLHCQLTRIISRVRHEDVLHNNITKWTFIPHYPYPPDNRGWHLGMQCGGGFKLGMYVHVTPHGFLIDTKDPLYDDQCQVSKRTRRPVKGRGDKVHLMAVKDGLKNRWMPNGKGDDVFAAGDVHPVFKKNKDFQVLSNSCNQAGYRVMLWYNNPHHFLTGYVEAECSMGYPSQMDKMGGGEHPMWIVSPLPGSSHMINERMGGALTKLGSGWIDSFFDWWLPFIVDMLRTLNRGKDIAEKLHEEVVSKDGMSRPAGKNPPIGTKGHCVVTLKAHGHEDAEKTGKTGARKEERTPRKKSPRG